MRGKRWSENVKGRDSEVEFRDEMMTIEERLASSRKHLSELAKSAYERHVADKECAVHFTDPIGVLEWFTKTECLFTCDEMGVTLSSKAMEFGAYRRRGAFDLKDAGAMQLLAEELAQTALYYVGLNTLHNRTLLSYGIAQQAAKRRRGAKLRMSDQFTVDQLLRTVALVYHCDSARGVPRPPRIIGEKQMLAFAVVLSDGTVIEPRGYFSSQEVALRDALINALDPVRPLKELPRIVRFAYVSEQDDDEEEEEDSASETVDDSRSPSSRSDDATADLHPPLHPPPETPSTAVESQS